MYSARDNEGHLKVCLIVIFKVNYGGQVTYISHIEIPNIGYVQIDTNIESLSHIQPMIIIIIIIIIKTVSFTCQTSGSSARITDTDQYHMLNSQKQI